MKLGDTHKTEPKFVLVYQSGHQNVYCNKHEHIWMTGGWAGKWPEKEIRRGKCDCERWNAETR